MNEQENEYSAVEKAYMEFDPFRRHDWDNEFMIFKAGYNACSKEKDEQIAELKKEIIDCQFQFCKSLESEASIALRWNSDSKCKDGQIKKLKDALEIISKDFIKDFIEANPWTSIPSESARIAINTLKELEGKDEISKNNLL